MKFIFNFGLGLLAEYGPIVNIAVFLLFSKKQDAALKLPKRGKYRKISIIGKLCIFKKPNVDHDKMPEIGRGISKG